MEFELALQEFDIGNKVLRLYVPIEKDVKNKYTKGSATTHNTSFPYWARVWASSIGLAGFIQEHPSYVRNKVILELAAGLGLPSFVAASHAQSVCVSDYQTEALFVINKSIRINKLTNVNTRLLDWHNLPDDLSCDVLLLSDVNYNPTEFKVLEQVLLYFMKKSATILLSSPQRLMAKSFIEALLPYCLKATEKEVSLNGTTTLVSIFVLSFHH